MAGRSRGPGNRAEGPVAGAAPPGTRNAARLGEILDAARDVLLEKGYKAVTLEEVATRVGMLKGSLYYFVRNKEDLLRQTVARSSVEHLAALFEDPGVIEGDARQRLSHFIDRQIGKLDRDLWWRTVLEGHYVFSGEQMAGLHELGAELERLLTDIITQGVREGIFASQVDVPLAASTIVTTLSSTGGWYVRSGRSAEDIAAWYKSFIIGGLRAPEKES